MTYACRNPLGQRAARGGAGLPRLLPSSSKSAIVDALKRLKRETDWPVSQVTLVLRDSAPSCRRKLGPPAPLQEHRGQRCRKDDSFCDVKGKRPVVVDRVPRESEASNQVAFRVGSRPSRPSRMRLPKSVINHDCPIEGFEDREERFVLIRADARSGHPAFVRLAVAPQEGRQPDGALHRASVGTRTLAICTVTASVERTGESGTRGCLPSERLHAVSSASEARLRHGFSRRHLI